ncbi:MAG: TolC family protein [Paludibacteraceae bacterium]|nr:TolC family protein [Paludibacteraceae bacterium]
MHTSAQAQEVLSLKKCIETGLENNYSIRISRNEQKIAENNQSVGNAGMLPVVDLNAGYSGSLNNTVQKPADGSADLSTNNVFNSGLQAGVNLNWTVFDGFRMFVNYDKLQGMNEMGELRSRLTVENFIASLSAEYFNFVQQQIRLNNLKSAVKLSKERLRIVEARYNIGSMSRLDLQQARVDFNADSSRLIRQQEVLFSSGVKLNKLMAATEVENKIVLEDTTIVFNALLSKEALWENTLSSNIFLQLADKEKSISLLDLKASQSKNYPYVRLNAGYGYTQNNYEIATYRRQDNFGPNVGLTLGFNIFDGMNRVREQRNARIQAENKQLAIQELQLSLKSDFSNLWMAYRNNMELTTLERENLVNAHENYEIAIERYKLGDLSGIELREAQNSLLEAEERLVQTEYSTKLCEISLLQISAQMDDLLE